MKSGIINVYKEAGYTSFDVVAKLRGILHIKKIGHTGTLDPDAVGVLPICVGKATKVCDMLTNTDKTYVATLLMGVSTDTYDASGTILDEKEVNVTPEMVDDLEGYAKSLQLSLKVNKLKNSVEYTFWYIGMRDEDIVGSITFRNNEINESSEDLDAYADR